MNDLDEKTVARFWAKVNKDGPVHPTLGTKCWLWTASLNAYGYGQFRVNGTMRGAHRVSVVVGGRLIPEGLDLDHLCRVRSCVNPAHLEGVTRKENLRRGDSCLHHTSKMRCPQGHEYEGINLIEYRGYRYCRECQRARSRAYMARKRAEARRGAHG